MQIGVPLVDLRRTAQGPRDRQLLLGDAVDVLETQSESVRVKALKDGYTGYLPARVLAPRSPPTHFVCAAATHAYHEPDLKSPDLELLSFGAGLTVSGKQNGFARTNRGYVPAIHLRPRETPCADPIEVAELFLGTPYLWGGNSRSGIDCSGLVQAACLACDIPCPADSGPQEAYLGHSLPKDTPPQRGDLLFWKGHVAWVISPTRLLHANAHAMATTTEDLQTAIARIKAAGDGPVTSHKRL